VGGKLFFKRIFLPVFHQFLYILIIFYLILNLFIVHFINILKTAVLFSKHLAESFLRFFQNWQSSFFDGGNCQKHKEQNFSPLPC